MKMLCYIQIQSNEYSPLVVTGSSDFLHYLLHYLYFVHGFSPVCRFICARIFATLTIDKLQRNCTIFLLFNPIRLFRFTCGRRPTGHRVIPVVVFVVVFVVVVVGVGAETTCKHMYGLCIIRRENKFLPATCPCMSPAAQSINFFYFL